jgi:hypothetical protein
MIRIELFEGKDVTPFIDQISHLRIQIFREYPYLYQGDLDYEKNYMAAYATDPRALFAMAFNKDKVIGAITGIPLNSHSEIVREVKKKALSIGLPVSLYYYIGEALLLPEYRDNGIGRLIHTAYLDIENIIRQQGFQYASILTVKREENDTRKPENYRELEKIWSYLGFQKIPELETKYHWNTLLSDEKCECIENAMDFWQKPLR